MEIALSQVLPGRYQPRLHFNETKMEVLANSLKENGQWTPIRVFRSIQGDTYELIAGERRWRASCALALANRGDLQMELTEAVAIVCQPKWPDLVANYFFLNGYTIRAEEDNSTNLSLIHAAAVLENIQQEDLTPVEIGRALQKLKDDYNLSLRDLANKVGQSKSWVDDHLQMVKLSPDVAGMYSSDDGNAPALDFTLARELARKIPANLQKPIVDYLAKLANLSKSNRELQKKIADFSRFIDPNRWSLSDGSTYSPLIFNRARLIRHLLETLPSKKLAQGLIDLDADNYNNYLSKKPLSLLKFGYDYDKVIKLLSGQENPWPAIAKDQGWTCDNCSLVGLVGGLDLRDDLLDHDAPCERLKRFGNKEANTCLGFVWRLDPQVIPVPPNVRNALDDELKEKLDRLQDGQLYVNTWIEYHELYTAARQNKASRDERDTEIARTAYLEPLRQYWHAQRVNAAPEGALHLDHFQAHACKKCRHFTAHGLGLPDAAPCRFADPDHALKNKYNEYFHHPAMGLLQSVQENILVPRCEKFQYRNLPEIAPLSGFKLPDRLLILEWFRLIKEKAAPYYHDAKKTWGVLAWLPDSLQNVWNVLDDERMMAILHAGVMESLNLRGYGEKVKLLDPTTGQVEDWLAINWKFDNGEKD